MGGAVLIISGPSGAGKSTLIKNAGPRIGDYYFSISTTTRAPREGERDGFDYFFTDRKSFEDDIKKGEFLEYAEVHGNYYGTSLKPVREALSSGRLVIFDIDVQGHRLARKKIGDIVTSVFITPPTPDELYKRLSARSTDSPDTIKRRMANAKSEIEAIREYDFLIINDDLESAVDSFVAVAGAARLKYGNADLEEFVRLWR
jgi:guanylate kinase